MTTLSVPGHVNNITTLSVLGHVNNIEAQAWHRVEKFAFDHPNAARLLSIAAAICKFVKHIFLPPVQFVENLILAGKSIRDYRRHTDQAEKNKCYDAFKSYLGDAVLSLLKTAVAPLEGSYYAITRLVSMTVSPLKTAKIEAAEADRSVYFDKEKTTKEWREAIEFVSRAAHARFETLVKSTNDNEDVAKLHFLDTDDAKEQTLAEIKLKMEKYAESYEAWFVKRQALRQEADKLNDKASWDSINEHDKRFDDFANELGMADVEHAKDMVYNPNAPVAVAVPPGTGNPTAVTQPASTSTTSETTAPATVVEVEKPVVVTQPTSTTTSETATPATTVEVQKPVTDTQPVSIAPEAVEPTAAELELQRLTQLVNNKWQADSETTNPVAVTQPVLTTSETVIPATTVETEKPATNTLPTASETVKPPVLETASPTADTLPVSTAADTTSPATLVVANPTADALPTVSETAILTADAQPASTATETANLAND
jgi:hypothetical protein